MERGDEHVALSSEHGDAIVAGEDDDSGVRRLDLRGADEHGVERRVETRRR